jgi:class 3 adenylate cyclase
MTPTDPRYWFPSLRDLWERNRETIEERQPFLLPFRAAIVDATVVFADVVGFTALTNEHPDDPAVAAFVVHRALAQFEQWTGMAWKRDIERIYLDKVVGDGFLFVIPGEAAETLRLGMRLAAAMFAGPRWVPIRVGLHRGDVCLCDVGLGEFGARMTPFEQITVMGAAVNLAARLAAVAGEWELAVLGEAIESARVSPPDVVVPTGMSWIHEGPPDRFPLKGFSIARDTAVRLFRGQSLVMKPWTTEAIAVVAATGRRLPRLRPHDR